MIKSEKKRINRALGIVFLAVTLLIIYICNDAVPIMMDDNWYATRLFDEQPVQSLTDVIAAQKWHYFNWGGRSIAHGLLQLTLMQGEFWANIINIFFNIVLGMLICKIAHVKGSWFLGITLGFLYGLNPDWRQSLCWQSGAANYLYMSFFVLLFLWCYERTLEENTKALPGISVWIVPLGLAAGWSNENMGPTAWLLSLAVMLYLWSREKRFYPWMALGNVMCLLGSCLVILAPGNFARAGEVIDEKGLLWKSFLRCYTECKALFEYLGMALLLLAVLLFVSICICNMSMKKKTWIYLAAAILSWGAMLLSPHYPERATFGTLVFMICAIISLAGEIMKQKPEWKRGMLLAGLVIWLRGMFFMMEYSCMIWGWIV